MSKAKTDLELALAELDELGTESVEAPVKHEAAAPSEVDELEAELEAALSEIDLDDLDVKEEIKVEEAVKESIAEKGDVENSLKDLEDVEKEIAMAAEVEASYEELEKEKISSTDAAPKAASETPTETTTTADEAPSEKPSRAATRTPASETLRRRIGLSEEAIIKMLTPEQQAEKDPDKLEAHVTAKLQQIDAAPVKVGEKVVNTLAALNGSAQLSVYTRIALEELAKTGKHSQPELKERYLTNPDRPYTEGTANAQSGQMTHLFPILGIAHVMGKQYSLIEDSTIFNELNNIFRFTEK